MLQAKKHLAVDMLPDSLQDAVIARVDELPDLSRKLLKIASCFGFVFDSGHVKSVSQKFLEGVSEDELSTALDHLVKQEFLAHGMVGTDRGRPPCSAA